MRYRFAALMGAALGLAAGTWAQTTMSFDQMIDRALARENRLLIQLRAQKPIAETYIQDLQTDSDFGSVPRADHYFLGRVDFSKGLSETSYVATDRTASTGVMGIFRAQYLPRGFAQMMVIDGAAFDRGHYDFEFVRREFLGDVRTYVVKVTPRRDAGRGRFVGEIWIEDHDFNIVRFNGTYSGGTATRMYMHFDSWRTNTGPDLWLPAEIYSEESALKGSFGINAMHFKALTKVWGYGGPEARAREEFTNLMIETAKVRDKSELAAENSPVESLRAWQRQSEDNMLDRMEKAGLLARRGGVDQVLDTVVNNLIVTNKLDISPSVRTRALLTTPLESFNIGHTIVMSRGLIDTLPDEASLAAVLAHGLAHIVLGHRVPTDFAFADREQFGDQAIVAKFRLGHTPDEEAAANEKAVAILMNSPYKDKVAQAGLFLKALGAEAPQLPSLIRPLFGGPLAQGESVLLMPALIEKAPKLETTRVDQIAALPLGSRTKLDPWSDDLEMAPTRPTPIASPDEKMPFELAPVYLHLTYQSRAARQVAAN